MRKADISGFKSAVARAIKDHVALSIEAGLSVETICFGAGPFINVPRNLPRSVKEPITIANYAAALDACLPLARDSNEAGLIPDLIIYGGIVGRRGLGRWATPKGRSRWSVAIHEAGHAVVASVLGRRGFWVTANTDVAKLSGGDDCGGFVRLARPFSNTDNSLAILMAGLQAEEEFGALNGECGSRTDYMTAIRIASRICPSRIDIDGLIEAQETRARRIIRKHREAVKIVAELLMVHDCVVDLQVEFAIADPSERHDYPITDRQKKREAAKRKAKRGARRDVRTAPCPSH